MSKPKIAWTFYGVGALGGSDVAIAAKFDVVVMATSSNFAVNAAAIRAINPKCKILAYLDWAYASPGYGSSPKAWCQQTSKENWHLRQSSASSPTSPILSGYATALASTANVAVNNVKVGPVSGLKPHEWYITNVVPALPGVSVCDGFFVDDSSLGPVTNFATTVDVGSSGTATEGTGATKIVDAGKAWGSMTNRLVRMTSGAAAGQINWAVVGNTATSMTMLFAFSPAPTAGDTYEVYKYSSPLSTASSINADYTETGAPVNFDSLAWKNAIATERIAGINMLLGAYPNALIMANDGRGFYCPQSANLNRERVGVYYEGTINTGYQDGWTAAMSQTQCNTRRLSASLTVVSGMASSATDWVTTRYVMSAALLGDGLAHVGVNGSYSVTTPVYLDEYNIDLGEPASDTTRNADGTYFREYTQAYVVANPTAGTIAVTVPAGFRRIRASDYANQDPTLNDGSTSAVSLAPETAVMFVRA